MPTVVPGRAGVDQTPTSISALGEQLRDAARGVRGRLRRRDDPDDAAALRASSPSVILVIAVFLLVAAGLLILNTIRMAMFARRREIEVMKLVGATNWFIRVPFMLEGLVQGLVGGRPCGRAARALQPARFGVVWPPRAAPHPRQRPYVLERRGLRHLRRAAHRGLPGRRGGVRHRRHPLPRRLSRAAPPRPRGDSLNRESIHASGILWSHERHVSAVSHPSG